MVSRGKDIGKGLSIVLHCALCVMVLMLCLPAAVTAQTINYPDDGPLLRNEKTVVPAWDNPDSLFPDSPSGNTVTVTGGTVPGNAEGGLSNAGDVKNNRIMAIGGTVGGNVYGGSSISGTATGNSATIAGGAVDGYVYGGSSFLGTATDNSATINGGTVTGRVYGGVSATGVAAGNSVTITGGTVTGNVYGGASNGSGAASGNSVTITGGTVNGAVYGGYSTSGTATGNSVTISGSPVFGTGTRIHGGFSGSAGNAFSGNTLNLYNWTGTVAGIQRFETVNFTLPASMRNGGTALAATGVSDLTNPARQTTVNVNILSGGTALAVGDSVRLIDASGGSLAGTPANTTAQGVKGIFLLYDFDLTAQTGANGFVDATVAGVRATPRAKALSEGRVAGHAFLNQGSDLIIGPGLYSILQSTRATAQGALVPFAVGQGGRSRYDTGSHADVSGASIMTGLAWRRPLNDKGSNILAGFFFEAGWGGYDSHNSFSNYASVKGDGDISYHGGGVLARYAAACGGYFDASFRAGQVKTDFNTSDLRDGFTGETADYDSSSAYYGAHAGIGYVWSLTEKASLDLSTRYIWTHQDSDSVKVANDPIRFKAADSHRWRTGARFAYAVNEYVAPYAGAYFDYEFDGKARASAHGYGIDAPDLNGGTGVGELGLSIKPVKNSGLSLDLGAQGYAGVREGVTGSLQLKYEF